MTCSVKSITGFDSLKVSNHGRQKQIKMKSLKTFLNFRRINRPEKGNAESIIGP
jgi:hypothetical protein